MPKKTVHFPRQNWPKICVWSSKHLPDLDAKADKLGFLGPKISLRYGVIVMPNINKTTIKRRLSAKYRQMRKEYWRGKLGSYKKLRCQDKVTFHSNCQMQRQTQNALFFPEASSPEAITLGANYARSSLSSIRYH